ncbi:MAG TPA: mechanosensitive ion channel domain-containing protein [Vicinamibacterales bacterium]|nr:mechanosensitive ion channel domain-containing protein [Vicinamibacterales bacterium]
MTLRFASWSIAVCLLTPVLSAQTAQNTTPPATQATPPVEAAVAAALTQSETFGSAPATLTLTYANRPIIKFRASVGGRAPADRVAAARQVLDRIVEGGIISPVETTAVGPAMALTVGGFTVFFILPADIDPLAGETLSSAAAGAATRLQEALNEVAEARRPQQMFIAVLLVIFVTIGFAVLVWLLIRLRRGAGERLTDKAMKGLRSKVGDEEFLRSSRILEFLQHIINVIAWSIGLFLAYSWLTFSLRRFPYTRYWGESLRGFLLERLSHAGAAVISALPGLFMVALIVLITRFASRLIQVFFQAVQDRRIKLRWVYPETADPTRKLFSAGLWLFAIAIAYPYLPGSESEAFKGVSVFAGLMVSLGSSGLVNQVMSGFTLIYSRALRKGDFVMIGDVEGTVAQLGTLSTKIRTAANEDVTIPNAVVVAQVVTNYTRGAEEGVFVPTSVTIGYDVAWRQVEALLLLAASKTPGVRKQPPPIVRQAELEDAYVKYTLFFCLEDPTKRRPVRSAVNANILDAFNEYGVQITSPRYEADPADKKIVPKDKWFPDPVLEQTRKKE